VSPAAAPSARTYAGWQREKVAFLFGLSGPRVASVAAAVLLAVLPLLESSLRAALVSLPLAAALLLCAFARVAGRTLDEWALTAMHFSLLKARNRTRYVAGPFAPLDPANPAAPPPLDLPGILAPLKFLEAPNGSGGSMAVAHHPYERTYTAAARIEFPGIALVDSNRRDRRVAGWGALIAGLCTEGNPITRVQTLQRIVPESGAALRQWHEDHLAGAAPDLARQIATTLVDGAAPTAARRENYLVFTLDAARAASTIRAAGGGDTGACAVLARQCRALVNAINSASLQISEWLDPREMAAVIRTAFDPHEQQAIEARHARAARGRRDAVASGVHPRLTGPAAADNQWAQYRHDGAWTASFSVGEWPLAPVYANFLLPMLNEASGHRRSFSLHFEPLGPRTAQRAVAIERTQRETATRLRAKTGQIIPEHERLAQARAEHQDAERAAGHGLVRLTGYISVTVTDPGELDGAIAQLRADADAARIELRRMYGAQDVGFVLSALPLGMGLPRRRL
jgi:hypothetical protein